MTKKELNRYKETYRQARKCLELLQIKQNKKQANLQKEAITIVDLKDLICKAVDELQRIEAFIRTVPNINVRRALTSKYIEGLTWAEVAKKWGYKNGEIARKHVNKYIKKEPE